MGGLHGIPRRPAVVNRLQQRQPASDGHRQQRQMPRRVGGGQRIVQRVRRAVQVLRVDRAAAGAAPHPLRSRVARPDGKRQAGSDATRGTALPDGMLPSSHPACQWSAPAPPVLAALSSRYQEIVARISTADRYHPKRCLVSIRHRTACVARRGLAFAWPDHRIPLSSSAARRWLQRTPSWVSDLPGSLVRSPFPSVRATQRHARSRLPHLDRLPNTRNKMRCF